jgi:hypothetical protein
MQTTKRQKHFRELIHFPRPRKAAFAICTTRHPGRLMEKGPMKLRIKRGRNWLDAAREARARASARHSALRRALALPEQMFVSE